MTDNLGSEQSGDDNRTHPHVRQHKPGPTPNTAAKATPAKPIGGAAGDDPGVWGRVDEQGTVWLKTAGGERIVGSWQAGDAAEGLAHFQRRFSDLATEVTLLEARLASGTGDARKTRAAAEALAESLPTAAVVGDVEGLARRLTAIVEQSDRAAAQMAQHREHQRREQIKRKEELVAEAERIASESTQWKSAGDRLRVILDEWKTVRSTDRKTDDALWKRFTKARDAFGRRRGAYFAELDRERASARAHKEQLCLRAEELAHSTDWGAGATAFRELLAEWKAAGRAPREADDALWKRFKAAQDVFFSHRNAAQSARDEEFRANAEAKEALLRRVEQIDIGSNVESARATLREIQDKWESIGRVPRDRTQQLEDRLKEMERRIRDAADSRWRRTDPEAQARAAQFRERVAQFEQQAAKAKAAGRTRDEQQALEQARQWREWANTAESAVHNR